MLGFAALSWACGLLLAMAILVTWQAFIPAGTVRASHLAAQPALASRPQPPLLADRAHLHPLRGPAADPQWSATLARSLTEARTAAAWCS